MLTRCSLIAAALIAISIATPAHAQGVGCEDRVKLDDQVMAAYQFGPPLPPPSAEPAPNPFELRALKYAALALKHRLNGLASYYSTSLDGTLTATGEIFRNKQLTAAHLTLPLGTWIEVKARATGKTIRCRVNDRGPYARKFILDLSQAAARALGVDRADDRSVEIRIVALPGEKPLPEGFDLPLRPASGSVAAEAVTAQ